MLHDTGTKIDRCERAIELLKAARDNLKMAGAERAATAARKALDSAEGALRHAVAREMNRRTNFSRFA
jgi:hypothetical protein